MQTEVEHAAATGAAPATPQTGLDREDAPDASTARQMLDAIAGAFWCVYIGGRRYEGTGWSPKGLGQYVQHGVTAFLPLYVGPQIIPDQGIDDTALLTAAQGYTDGQQAVSILRAYGWTAGSPCAADVEQGTSDGAPAGATAYIDGFSVALREGGYVPGVYCVPSFVPLLVGQTNRPSFVHIASWFSHGVDHTKDPAIIPGLDNGDWVQARVWQYAGAYDSIPVRVLGLDVDIDVANIPLAPAPGQVMASAGHLVDPCALKFEPNHTCPAVIHAPQGAAVAVLPWRATTNNEAWQRVQYGNHEGWVPAAKIRVP